MYIQERAMRSGVHIVVATPGRCLDHISRGTLKLENVRHVVLDEGDTMLEMGFQKDVESIIANVKVRTRKHFFIISCAILLTYRYASLGTWREIENESTEGARGLLLRQ